MIYIATHKHYNELELAGYKSLQVGALGKEGLGYLRDDSGENISEKNPGFCELTGLYWIWKNCDDDYKGLVHYRRYFGKSNFGKGRSDIYTYQQMVDMLSDCDMILPYTEYFKQAARRELLKQCCSEHNFEELKKSVEKLYPEYIKDFDTFFTDNKASLFNMMFCRKELFDEYCKWLFDILLDLEKHADLSNANDYQKRLYGFLSERLLNIWIRHNALKVKRTPVINTEMSFGTKVTLMRRRITNRIFFKIAGREK